MRSIKMFGLAIVAVLAFAAIGAGAASAHEFIASKTGSLKGSASGNQTFEVSSGSGEDVVCKTLSVSGTVSSLKTETQAVVVQYEGCEANTFLGKLSATISAADYTFNAAGTVTITKPIEINIGGIATQTVGDQGPLSSITFSNSSGKIDVDASVSKISSSGSLGSQTTGTYVGNSVVELSGGTIEWK